MLKTLDVQREFVLDPSLVLYLPLYKLDGGKISSQDAYGHLCTVSGALKAFKGREFDGSVDFIDVAHHPNHLLTFGGTILVWLRADGFGGNNSGRIVDKSTGDNGQNGWKFLITATNSRVRMQINGGTTVHSAINSTVFGEWCHVGTTWNTLGDVIMYIKGLQSGTPANSAAASGITTTNDMRIGNVAGGTSRSFKGAMGEVWIYNRVLTPLEIQHNYLATKWRYGEI